MLYKDMSVYFLAEYESAQSNPVEFENTWAIENGY